MFKREQFYELPSTKLYMSVYTILKCNKPPLIREVIFMNYKFMFQNSSDTVLIIILLKISAINLKVVKNHGDDLSPNCNIYF